MYFHISNIQITTSIIFKIFRVMDDNSWVNKINIIDSFGVSYNFQIKTKDKFKTTLGALFTILYYLVILILFFQLGEDVYKREKPKVSLNTDIKNYQEVQLSNKNFTYAYRVEDKTGLQVKDRSKFYQKVLYFHYEMVNGTWNNLLEKYLPEFKCSEISYNDERERYFNISLENWNCIDFDNIKLGGNWDGNFVYGLEILTMQCQNGTDQICSSKEEINNFFSPEVQGNRIFYSDLSMEIYPSMDDYEAPLKTHLVNNYELLNMGLIKRNIKTFKSTKMVNDIGWFLPDYLNQELILSTDTTFRDFTFKNPENSFQLFDQFLYLGRKVDTYNRSYYKIQEAIAAVGGFSRILFIILNFIFFYAAQTYRSLFLISNLFNGKEEINICKNKYRPVFNNSNRNNTFNNSEVNRLNFARKDFRKNFLVNLNNFESINKNILRSESKIDVSNISNVKSESKTKIYKNKMVATIVKKNTDKQANIIYYKDYFIYKYFCCIKNNNADLKTHLNMIKDYQSYFSRCLDVFTYFNTLNEFKNLKRMLLSKQERENLEMRKHKIKDKLNITKIESKINRIVKNVT